MKTTLILIIAIFSQLLANSQSLAKQNGSTIEYFYSGDYENILNFDKASEEVQQSKGFYKIVKPQLTDSFTYGLIYFDNANKVFTYTTIKKYYPSAEELFNAQQCKNDLMDLFSSDLSAFGVYNATLSDMIANKIEADKPNVYRKSFTKMKAYMNYRVQIGEVTPAQLVLFYRAFSNQNINLNNY